LLQLCVLRHFYSPYHEIKHHPLFNKALGLHNAYFLNYILHLEETRRTLIAVLILIASLPLKLSHEDIIIVFLIFAGAIESILLTDLI
jgi:hypothetical protein